MAEFTGERRTESLLGASVLRILLLNVVAFKKKYGVKPTTIFVNTDLKNILWYELSLLEVDPTRIFGCEITFFYATKGSLELKPEAQWLVLRNGLAEECI